MLFLRGKVRRARVTEAVSSPYTLTGWTHWSCQSQQTMTSRNHGNTYCTLSQLQLHCVCVDSNIVPPTAFCFCSYLNDVFYCSVFKQRTQRFYADRVAFNAVCCWPLTSGPREPWALLFMFNIQGLSQHVNLSNTRNETWSISAFFISASFTFEQLHNHSFTLHSSCTVSEGQLSTLLQQYSRKILEHCFIGKSMEQTSSCMLLWQTLTAAVLLCHTEDGKRTTKASRWSHKTKE